MRKMAAPRRRLARCCAHLAVAALVVAGAGPAGADARSHAAPVIELEALFSFSPNGDGVKDAAVVRYTLAKKSEVIVKVRRDNKARTVVYKERLGKFSSGSHTWTWKGKNLHGKVVRDGRYSAVFVADQVAEDGKTRRAYAAVYVDTRFNAPWAPEVNADTVYPNTTLIHDAVGITLSNDGDDPMTALGRVVMRVKDAHGRAVLKTRGFEYHADPYEAALPILLTGRNDYNEPLPAGAYRVRFNVWDMAGNAGGSKAVTVQVSDKPLVEASGSVVVPPTGAWKASRLTAGGRAAMTTAQVRDDRSSTAGCCDTQPVPCGTVVPSEVYPDLGAMSFRSSDTCGGSPLRPSLAMAGGGLALDTLSPQVAPRGLRTSWLTMRGRPTVTGEVDTARLFSTGVSFFYDTSGPYVASAAVPEETLTTTQPTSYPWEPQYFGGYAWGVDWSIATLGVDSYDVASVVVHYTYLTPQVP